MPRRPPPSTPASPGRVPAPPADDPFASLCDALRRDGLAEHADRLDVARTTPTTSSSELIGDVGLELIRIRVESSTRWSAATRHAFRAAAQVVREVFPRMGL